ncbi:MAG: DUF1549 and DUF1553 domain-containing protein [Gemmataceae bacterium]
MKTRWTMCLGMALLLAAPSVQAGPQDNRDALALAAKIDQLIAARWQKEGIKPAAQADDAEFMRRAYLDLAGRIPRVSEARAFLEDTRSDKRERLVEELLESPQYVNHMTNTFRALMLPSSNNNRFLDPNFSTWLSRQFRDNVGYDEMVRELLTAPVVFNGRNPRAVNQPGAGSVLAFYQANELKPENLAATTSRLFLGIKLECAQCHDHPFASYTRKQFWELAAFYAGIESRGQNGFYQATGDKDNVHEIKISGTDKLVQARYLDGSEPKFQTDTPVRETLAGWITAKENPYFARATANRLWAHFFGIGIIEPLEEPSDDNPPSHPELLDEMAKQLAAHNFDLKFLMRAIVNSKTYQLSSAIDGEAADERVFQRMALKGLTPDQLCDSLARATGFRARGQPNQRFNGVIQLGTARGEFLNKFASQDKRTEFQTSILQALTLMNAKFINDATDSKSVDQSLNERMAAVWDAPFLDTPAKKIEALYLSTLSRKPRSNELDRLVKYVESGGPKKDPKTALGDVFWAILNSPEFFFNH